MRKKIVTISREFGSGGRMVAEKLARMLGWKMYDSAIIQKISEKSGLSKEFIEERGEYATSGQNFVYSVPAGCGGFSAGQSIFDKLYIEQYNIIKELAEGEPCVIVGRCADYILRERDDVLSVFIYASMERRIFQITEAYKDVYNFDAASVKDIGKFLEGLDKKRKLYYKYNTDRAWDDVRNYDICFNSGLLGVDTVASLILAVITGDKS